MSGQQTKKGETCKRVADLGLNRCILATFFGGGGGGGGAIFHSVTEEE